MEKLVTINAKGIELEGFLNLPEYATSIIVFVHGSGSSRHSPRNQSVAKEFNTHGMATLLFDLFTVEEEKIDMLTREKRFNISLLSERVIAVINWLGKYELTNKMKIGLIGSSTGAAGALVAGAHCPQEVRAIVSRGGRPDLAAESLSLVAAPTLLIVGSLDHPVINLNEQALSQMNCNKKLELVEGATHLFEEVGTLAAASRLARKWFLLHLNS